MMTKDASFISNEDLTTTVWFAVVALVFGAIIFCEPPLRNRTCHWDDRRCRARQILQSCKNALSITMWSLGAPNKLLRDMNFRSFFKVRFCISKESRELKALFHPRLKIHIGAHKQTGCLRSSQNTREVFFLSCLECSAIKQL